MHISPLRIIKIVASSALITIQIAMKTVGVTCSAKNIACSNAFAAKLKFYLVQEFNLVDMRMTNYAYKTSYSCTNETVSGVRIALSLYINANESSVSGTVRERNSRRLRYTKQHRLESVAALTKLTLICAENFNLFKKVHGGLHAFSVG
jgi:hypothetical protein